MTTELQARVLRPGEIQSHDRGGGARTTPLVSPSIGATGETRPVAAEHAR